MARRAGLLLHSDDTTPGTPHGGSMTFTITITEISATEFRLTVTADIRISSGIISRSHRSPTCTAADPAEAKKSDDSPILTVEQAAKLLHIGRDKVYYLIRSRQLRSIKIGKLRRISRDWIHEYVRQREGC